MLSLLLAIILGSPVPQHQNDLVLEAKSPATSKIGDDYQVTLTLVNRGKATLPVVKPSDGSEVNWREPYVWFTAERETKGEWVAVPKATIARCGLYDFDWDKDTVSLAPGQRLDIGEWVNRPQYSTTIDTPGRYRIVAHYAFGTATRSQNPPTKGMQGVAPFEIVSAPFVVERTK